MIRERSGFYLAINVQRELAERTMPNPTRPYYLSMFHAVLRENEPAFAALEQALVERDCFLAWLPVGRSLNELMNLESDPLWPVFVEKVKAAVQADGRATERSSFFFNQSGR